MAARSSASAARWVWPVSGQAGALVLFAVPLVAAGWGLLGIGSGTDDALRPADVVVRLEVGGREARLTADVAVPQDTVDGLVITEAFLVVHDRDFASRVGAGGARRAQKRAAGDVFQRHHL